MNRRAVALVALSCLLAVMVGCTAKVPTPSLPPSATPPPISPSSTPTQVVLSSAPTQVVPSSTPTFTREPSPTPTSTGCTRLLSPPDGLAATFVDLVWDWASMLEGDQWFEVRIRLDEPGEQPIIYYWVWEPWLRVTSSMLEPGRYRWHVCVVRGDGESPGTEAICPVPQADERIFILTGPATQATLSVTPVATETATPSSTPSPTWPWATATATPTGTVTVTMTSTPTPSVTGSLTPTATPTPSVTGSLTPTYTPTPSATGSLTPTSTSTPSPTSSSTPTYTPTSSYTPTPTQTGSPVPTVPSPTLPVPTVPGP